VTAKALSKVFDCGSLRANAGRLGIVLTTRAARVYRRLGAISQEEGNNVELRFTPPLRTRPIEHSTKSSFRKKKG